VGWSEGDILESDEFHWLVSKIKRKIVPPEYFDKAVWKVEKMEYPKVVE
jgi:hypothetical protein